MAEYYEVDRKALNMIKQRHEDELLEDGYEVVEGKELKEIKQKIKNSTRKQLVTLYEKIKRVRHISLFPRRAVLRVGMLLRDSEIAKKVRDYLLDVEEVATGKQKEKYTKVKVFLVLLYKVILVSCVLIDSISYDFE